MFLQFIVHAAVSSTGKPHDALCAAFESSGLVTGMLNCETTEMRAKQSSSARVKCAVVPDSEVTDAIASAEQFIRDVRGLVGGSAVFMR